MFCPKCGTSLDAEDEFCPDCGAQARKGTALSTSIPTPSGAKKKKLLKRPLAILIVILAIVLGGGLAFGGFLLWGRTPEQVSLYVAKVNDKYGYIDSVGKLVIHPQFDDARYFSEGLASVKVGAKYGYIDKTGSFVVNPQFDWVDVFSEQLARILVGDKYGYIDKTGSQVINPQFDDAAGFSEGLALVKVGGQYGYIDKTGSFIVNPQFDIAGYFFEGLAFVKVGDKYGYIDKTSNYVVNLQFDGAMSFYEGLASVEVGDKYGYIDKTGSFVVNPQFDSAAGFSEDLASVEVGGKWGCIDKTGSFVVNPQFDSAWLFSEGLAAVQVGDKWGYIDKTGSFVVNPQFNIAGDFSEGLAEVSVGDKEGYIDKTGRIIWPAELSLQISASPNQTSPPTSNTPASSPSSSTSSPSPSSASTLPPPSSIASPSPIQTPSIEPTPSLPPSSQEPLEPIKIGLQAPITGDFSAEGQWAKQCVEVAVDLINMNGGVLGRKVEIVVADDASNSKDSALAAQKLISQGLKEVIASYGSSVTRPAADLYDKNKVVSVGYGCTAVSLTMDKQRPYFFRTARNDNVEPEFFAKLAAEKLGAKRIAIMHDNQDYGKGVAEDAMKYLKPYLDAGKTEVVYYDAITPGESNYSEAIAKLKQATPDLWFYTGYYPEAALLIKQAREMGFDVTFVGNSGIPTPEFEKIAGVDAIKGTYMLNEPMPQFLAFPESKTFMDAYKVKYNELPGSIWAVYAADALNALCAAITKAGGTEPDKVAQAMRTMTDANGITGPLGFTDRGDRQDPPYAVYIYNDQGQLDPYQ